MQTYHQNSEIFVAAFGSAMPSRAWTDESRGYRFGFNGMEKDDEVKGAGNSYDFGARILDSRLGRFLSIDPLINLFPWYSGYIFAGNYPIWAIDIDGLVEYIVTYKYNESGKKIGTYLKIVSGTEEIAGTVVKYIHKYPRNYTGTKKVDETKNSFNTETEKGNAKKLVDSYFREKNKQQKSRITGIGWGESEEEAIPPSIVPVNPVPYNGRTVSPGDEITLNTQSIAWRSTSPNWGGRDPATGAPPINGGLTQEGKNELEKLARTINSMSGVNKITITTYMTVGTSNSDSEFSNADYANRLASQNAKEYLKSLLTNQNIEVVGKSSTKRSDTDHDFSTKAKIN